MEIERLLLRRVRKEDAEAFFEEFSDEYSCAMDDGSEPYSEMNDDFYDIIDMLVSRAGVIKENEPSIALLKKLGFEREGFLRKGFWSAKNGPMDMERFYRDRI